MFRHVYDYIKKYPVLLILIIPAFLLHMLIMMPSGTTLCLNGHCGTHFWGVNSFDGMWHLEVAAVAFSHFPFRVPTYTGGLLSGYNILMDYVLFLLSKVGIPPIITLFKIIPPIWFVLYTIVLIQLSRRIKDSALFVGCVLFFAYFAGHFGYFLQLYHDGSLLEGSQSFALQSATSLLNTQFALSLPLLLSILICIQKKTFDLKTAIIIGILTALNFGLKFYGGVVSLILVSLYLLESVLIKKDILLTLKQGLIIGFFVVISIIAFYNPFAATKTGSIFTFSPFATVHSFIESPNMVYLPDMVNARYFLYASGKMGPKLIAIELFSAALYVVFNFGTRLFGIIYIGWKLLTKKAKRLDVYVLVGIIFSTVLTILLIQKGDWWNTVQFSYYGIFLSNILAAHFLFDMLKKKNIILMLLAGLVIIFSIPSNLQVIKGFASPKSVYIPREEFAALDILKKQPEGIVFDSFDLLPKAHYPFMSYESTGYVAAFTGKQIYFGHTGPLTILGIEYKPRYARIKNKDCTIFHEVDYIYYVKNHSNSFLLSCQKDIKNGYNKLFEDNNVKIYKSKRTK